MRTCTLLLVAVVVAYAMASAATAETSICPWKTVAHVEDPSVQSIGRWAVEQQHSGEMHFVKVESAKAQAVGDCDNNINRIYDLIINASNPGAGYSKYNAVVSVINRTEPQRVLSFTVVSGR
ncbi:hypothetical protein QOZ80_5BG0432520 [Eleusine coracana subsp. coracana]|nr:hypothetical protein QOZ80_5BG0432520 [Eleusine coracana subsp. coracana]